MTEEEKKAIEKIKDYKELFSKGYCKDCNELCVIDNFPSKDLENNIDIILNIIEKLQKENEELKKNQRYKKDFNGDKIFSLEYDKETLRDMVVEKQEEIKELKLNSIPKDKIREFIKRLEKDVENIREKKKDSHDYDRSSSRIQAYLTKTREIIKRLKELLEEE